MDSSQENNDIADDLSICSWSKAEIVKFGALVTEMLQSSAVLHWGNTSPTCSQGDELILPLICNSLFLTRKNIFFYSFKILVVRGWTVGTRPPGRSCRGKHRSAVYYTERPVFTEFCRTHLLGKAQFTCLFHVDLNFQDCYRCGKPGLLLPSQKQGEMCKKPSNNSVSAFANYLRRKCYQSACVRV